MVEIMNEANNNFEQARVTGSLSMKNSITNPLDLQTDYDDLIKPQYLDEMEANAKIPNLPYTVQHKMIAHTEPCTALAFNPMGDTLATGGADKEVILWNVKKMQDVVRLKSKNHSICALAFSLDNFYLMSCSTDNRATLYTLRGNIKATQSYIAHQDLITSTKFCFSTKQVLTASLDQQIKCWDVSTCKSQRIINTFSGCYDMHVSRSETYIASGHKDTSIKLWNAKTKD